MGCKRVRVPGLQGTPEFSVGTQEVHDEGPYGRAACPLVGRTCPRGSISGVELLVKFPLKKPKFLSSELPCKLNQILPWTQPNRCSQAGGQILDPHNAFPLPSVFPHCSCSTGRAKVAQRLTLTEANLLVLCSHFNFCPQRTVLNIMN